MSSFLTEEALGQLTALAAQGLSDAEIAHALGVGEASLLRWQRRSTKLAEAVRLGRGRVHAQVEAALVTRALGFTCRETRTTTAGGKDSVVAVEKFVPPDTRAIIFYLKNRLPELWKDKELKAVLEDPKADDPLLVAVTRAIERDALDLGVERGAPIDAEEAE